MATTTLGFELAGHRPSLPWLPASNARHTHALDAGATRGVFQVVDHASSQLWFYRMTHQQLGAGVEPDLSFWAYTPVTPDDVETLVRGPLHVAGQPPHRSPFHSRHSLTAKELEMALAAQATRFGLAVGHCLIHLANTVDDLVQAAVARGHLDSTAGVERVLEFPHAV